MPTGTLLAKQDVDAYKLIVAGMARTKSVAASALESGPRWRPMKRSARGFVKRHPLSF